MIRKFIKLNIFILAFTALLAGTAHAQLLVEQGKLVMTVSGGERINQIITVHNTTNEEQRVKVYWEDFEYQPPYGGEKTFFPVGTGIATSAASMVSFPAQEFILPPLSKKDIECIVTVPADFNAGRYGVMFFERTSEPYKDSTGMSIITRVGSLFFIEPKGIEKKADLKNLKQDVATLTGEFHNMSSVILIPQITYYIMSADGLVVDRGEIKKLYVPSGVSANWTIPLPATLDPGDYSMVINADYEEGNVVVKEVGLTKDASGALTIGTVK